MNTFDNPKIVTSASKLYSMVIGTFHKLYQENKDSLLCSSNITCADTIIFSAFITRAIYIANNIKSKEEAETFDCLFLVKIRRYIFDNYLSRDELQEMFDNRMLFYEQIYMQKKGAPEKSLSALAEEFSYVIETNYIEKKYTPFSANSPLPIIDIFLHTNLTNDIKSYITNIFKKSAEIICNSDSAVTDNNNSKKNKDGIIPFFIILGIFLFLIVICIILV